MTCSAISLGSLSKSSALAASSWDVLPLGRVPAIGRKVATTPPYEALSALTITSGLEPMICQS